MTHWVIFPVLLPLLGGFIQLFARPKGIEWQRRIGVFLVLCALVFALSVFRLSLVGEQHVYYAGNWTAPFGIVLVLDKLSGLMVLLTAILAVISLLYSIIMRVDGQGQHFHVLFQLQLFGLNGAFLTGDVFNLFVFFEVLLLASYGLMLHGVGRPRVLAGLHYVSMNLIGSVLFLFAVGALYGAVGSLNMADMAQRIAQIPGERVGLVMSAGLLLLIVFGLKAAMFPLYLWLPATYANTSAPVAALFAIMTKVGIYSIIRVHGTLFGESAGALAYYYLPWVLAAGLITLVLGSLGVLAARRLRDQVAYLVVTSVATLLIAVGLNNATALSGALYYLVHSTLLTAAFFLIADLIVQKRVNEDHFVPSPLMQGGAWLGMLFMGAAVGMVGLPPLSGFFGKVMILSAAPEHAWFWWVLCSVLLASLFAMIALTRTGTLLFYRPLPKGQSTLPLFSLPKPEMQASLLALVLLLCSPLIVIGAGPLSDLTVQISEQLRDIPHYVNAVLVNQPGGLK